MLCAWFLRRALLTLACAALLPLPAIAGVQILDIDTGERLIRARGALPRTPARPNAVSTSDPETIWVGYWSGANTANNWWKVGGVPAGSGYRHPYNTNGMWTFEPDQQVHGDSLSGWWTMRREHRNFSGATLTDENRPWWAVPYGNTANHAGNPGDGSTRTFGVVGVWHRDAGNTAAQVLQTGVGGNPPHQPAWAPLSGGHSAWMGLRAHGDLTYQDPLTGNYFNADVVQFFGRNSSAPEHADKLLPGYVGDMDQMLYRDVDMTGYTGGGLSLRFTFRTNMSTEKETFDRIRTGWHEGDGLSQNQVTPGNFISAEADSDGLGPPNSSAPVDSFQIYLGAPVEGEWKTSLHPFDADGRLIALGVINPTTGRRIVGDALRRCFNEVLMKDGRRWLFSAAGDDAGSVTVSLSDLEVSALLDSAAAGGQAGGLRLVFRVHTNQSFDDALGSILGNYNSGYSGAAVVDDIQIDIGSTGNFSVIGDFEADGSIDNAPGVEALNAWKSTGKPPATYFHPHDMATLFYQDWCGPVGSTTRICNMEGVVVSYGLHDLIEATADPNPFSTERNGYWGMISPTINLAGADQNSIDPTRNNMNLTASERFATSDIHLTADWHWDAMWPYEDGQIFQFGFQSYPAQQADGVETWGNLQTPSFLYANGEPLCFNLTLDGAFEWDMIHTSNANGYPDSLRVFITKLSQCYRFGVTTACSSTDGNYVDNIGIALVDGVPSVLSIGIWNLFNDTFPANENAGLPGTAFFDTAAAHIKTGVNIAPSPGDLTRYSVPGDSLVAQVVGDSLRLDLMFRIMPGVGNYITIGDRSSGLRGSPTSALPHGPNHFWASYKTLPGTFAGPPGQINPGGAVSMHLAAPSGWSELVWNSARMDTVEQHSLFPLQTHGIGGVPDIGRWSSTYHEGELSARSSLGNPRNRCFLIDTLFNSIVDSNLNCGSKAPYPPMWVAMLPASQTGWDGSTTTIEGTKILPDGLLTPGAHVQYFVRRQDLLNPTNVFEMVPDTAIVSPQVYEGNTDGHRWQQFGVLPNRWNDSAFGGQGMACMLVYDNSDRRGGERVWKGIADSIGATRAEDRGTADGYGGVPGTGDVNNPAYFIANKNRNMGTLWDIYQMKASESWGTGAQSIGSRLGYRVPGSLMDDGAGNGKWTYNPPTPDMLNTFYKMLFVLTGNIGAAGAWPVWGPFADRSGDDIVMFEDWLQRGNLSAADRGILVVGSNFVDAADQGAQYDFVTQSLATTLTDWYYRIFASDVRDFVDLDASTPISASDVYGLHSSCLRDHDVVDANITIPGARVDLEYIDPSGTRWPAGVYKPHTSERPWISQTIAVDIEDLRGRFGSTYGRLALMYNTFTNVFGSICALVGAPGVTLDTPQAGDGNVFTNFANFKNNPLIHGNAVIDFGLAKGDFVQINVYDVAGRRVRKLAERLFKAGEHVIMWDGRNDQGHALPRGVYFTRVYYRDSGFEVARKVTVLK